MEPSIQPTPGHNAAPGPVTLTVVISSYNTQGLLADCLQSLQDNMPRESCEIIVIDDASSDGTSDMVSNRFPAVRLLRNEVNRHYAFSNNRAFDIALGEYILMLNSDTIVLPRALDDMIDFLRTHPDAGVVGCRLLNEDGSVQWSVKSLPNAGAALFGARSFMARLFPGNPFTRHHLLHLGRDTTKPFATEHGYVSSAAMMCPRGVVKKVGHLDSRLAYHVDADYCKRIADNGYTCWYLPTATIIHLNHKGGTTAGLRARFRSLQMFETHSYIYYRKHLQRPGWNVMNVAVPLGLFAHFLVLASAQVLVEAKSLVQSLFKPKKPSAPIS